MRLERGGIGLVQLALITATGKLLFDVPIRGSLLDLYGLGAGFLALGGPTITSSEIWWHPNAFEKMHWGWIEPAVVDQDGFQRIGRYDTTNEAYILYDPARPIDDDRDVQDDYFIVENRQRTPGTY